MTPTRRVTGPETAPPVLLDRDGLERLLGELRARGYTVVGPTVRDGAVVHDEIHSTDELPRGWTDTQEPGSYRLRRRAGEALFGYAVGPHSWKGHLRPPRQLEWTARRTPAGFDVIPVDGPVPRYAFFGVRACDLAALAVSDRVLTGGEHRDGRYARRRAGAFIVAVHCSDPSGACFCASMGTGPRARGGYDLAVTELLDGRRHDFLVEAGTPLGADVLATAGGRPAAETEIAAAAAVVDDAATRMGRDLDDPAAIRALLLANLEHPHWDDVASRCLSCGNCTMVCPTCFCTSAEERTDLDGTVSERWRRSDSCFAPDFSYVNGGPVRVSVRARYRQWLVHKLATWWEQFGTSGCVGCGRCITWCPAGIDLTEEIRALAKETAT